MKKLISILLIAGMLLTLVSCGKEKNTNKNISGTPEPTNVTSAPGPADTTSAPEPTTGAPAPTGSETTPTGTVPGTGTAPTIVPVKTSKLSLEGVISQPADGIGVPGTDFELLPTGPVQGWDEETPAPYFNPLGDKELYYSVYGSYTNEPWGYSKLDITYLDEDGVTPIKFGVYGQRWELQITHEKLTKNWLLYMAREQGAVIYPTTADSAVFSLRENETTLWWVVASFGDSNSVTLKLRRTNYRETGITYTLNTDDPVWKNNEYMQYTFYTEATPGKQQSMTIEFEKEGEDANSGIQINNYGIYEHGVTRHDLSKYYEICSPRRAMVSVLDDVPVVDGLLEWNFRIARADVLGAQTIRFTLNETAEIPEIVWGEDLGLVKIIGAPDGGGSFLTSISGRISHPEITEYSLTSPYRDEDGNYCIVAPCGYYHLTTASAAVSGIDHSGQIANVPVSSGRITEIQYPKELQATYSELIAKYRDSDSEAGGIEIQEITDLQETAQINMMVFDPLERDVFPETTDFQITENGQAGKVSKIERIPGQANVVLCMDSSGSMRKSMEAALEAAKRFVTSLPENSTIHVVQFEQKIIPHPGTTKEEAIAALNKIKAGGDTSMYDAVQTALDYLDGMERPYVVVFSDGADSREPGVGGTGSAISREDICSKIREAGVTLLSIGFGATHDPKALVEMSEASKEGAYFVAADDAALDAAFSSVTAKFGNQFVITYERPTVIKDVSSDVPVVSIMMDVSGSMNLDPVDFSGSDVDYRMHRVKKIFHDFILDLPQNTLMQFNTFTSSSGTPEIQFAQLTTDQKSSILHGIGSAAAGGGTPITEALEAVLSELGPITSTKRVLIFFTDAALAVEDDGSGAQQMMFEKALKGVKDSGIRVLFAGLGGEDYAKAHESVFKTAAELAGGDYIITASVDEIAAKLDELLAKIDTPVVQDTETMQLLLSLNCKTEDGSRMDYSASKQVPNFSVREAQGQKAAPGFITIKDGGAFIRYDEAGSRLLYGGDTPGQDSIIENRMFFEDAVTQNQFAEIKVTEAYFMSKFKGLTKDESMFLALNLDFTFQKQDSSQSQIGYRIPSIFQHFYVSCNNGRMMPASKATWLAEEALVNPGEPEITVMQKKDEKGNVLPRGETLSGIVVFEIDKDIFDELTQLSFHSYDTSFGHMELPLVGAMPQRLLEMNSMPTEEPKKISDAFSLQLTGQNDAKELEGVALADYSIYSDYNGRDLTSFRVLEAEFLSNVQALLNINPIERFYYKVATDSGDLLARMSPVVNNLPLGFTGDTMLAPASTTPVRLPFVLPTGLLSAKASLWGDLHSGMFDEPVQSGEVFKAGSDKKTFEHEYFTLTINDLAFSQQGRNTVILDFTVTDKKDGEGTGGFDSILMLKRDTSLLDLESNTEQTADGSTILKSIKRKGLGSFGDTTDVFEPLGVLPVNYDLTRSLIFGASYENGDWGAFDGQSRRGILVFQLPYDGYEDSWTLISEMIPGMEVSIDKEPYKALELLAELPKIDIDDTYQKALDELTDAAIKEYEATRPEPAAYEKIGLSDEEIIGEHIASPLLTVYGKQVIESVQTIEDFYRVMDSLTWLPRQYNYNLYSPQAVLTQGWGTDADFCELAKELLTRLGYRPVERTFNLTDTGWSNLERLGGFQERKLNSVFALSYTDANGAAHVYVPALRREAQELYGLGSVSSEPVTDNYRIVTGRILVTASGELTGDAKSGAQALVMSDMGSILGGAEENSNYYETVTLLDAEFDLDKIGQDFTDVSFVSVGKSSDGIHDIVTAIADSSAGLLTSPNEWIDTMNYKLDRIDIVVEGYGAPYEGARHTLMLKENDKLTDVFQSLAINVPELTKEAAESYEKVLNSLADSVSQTGSGASAANAPDTPYGTARWFTHAALSRLVYAISQYDNELCERLSLQSGRTDDILVLCSTLHSDGQDAIGSVDLMNLSNTLLTTSKLEELGVSDYDYFKTYHAMLGMFASQAEAAVLPDGQGKSYLDVWASLPADTGFINVDDNNEEREKAAAVLEERNFPKILIEHLRTDNDMGYLIPTKPGTLNGEERWAWLEINTETMEVVSVFDTGERSGMASFVLGLTPKSAAEFTVGALTGIALSHFGVSAYALELADYDDILAAAGSLLIFAYERLTQMEGGMKEAQEWLENPAGKMKDTLNEAFKERTSIDVNDLYEKYKNGFSPEVGVEAAEPTFSDGFKAVIEAYFGVTVEE